jgi:ATP-binding cassette subfamily C (CFTR/MRP) protein 1
MALATLRSASNLHYGMLQGILHAPMAFFETTPSGRIVNRFSKDVDTCDSILPFNLRLWIVCITNVVSIVLVITYSTPVFILVFIPIGVLYYFVQVFPLDLCNRNIYILHW